MKDLSKNVRRDFEMVVPKKFYDYFRHIFYINSIIGLFPISVKETNDFYHLKWSWLRVFIGNFFVLLYAVFTLTGLILSYQIEEVYNVRVSSLASLMSTLAEIGSTLFTWLITQLSVSLLYKQFWIYLLYLKKFDEIMGLIEPTRKIPFLIITVFSFTFTCLGMDIYMWAKIVVPVVGTFTFTWKLVPFYFAYFFSMIMELNFWITVYGITIRLKKLNNLVISYLNFSNNTYFITENNIKIVNNILKVNNGRRKNLLKCNMLTSSTVKSFIFAYDHISQANNALSKFYGLSMIVVLINVISCLVITPYILYQQILNSKEHDFLFTQSYWMLCHILRLLLLIEPCHNKQKAGINFQRSVTRLLGLESHEEVHKQIKVLLSLARENPIEFNAAGMIFINRSLLPTIGSAVFTYLAILFQYKNNP